jgi:multidrug efflux pump subunit AcrA (membrane-fusion protein)
MKRIAILAIMVIIVIAGAFAVMTAAFSPREHTVAAVRKGPIEQTVYATGFVEARERRVLRAQRAAVVGEVFERNGRRLIGERLLKK